MRTSAKLNLFFGVRNLSEEFLPAHLAYLESFFRRRAMNLFFPLSVGAACAVLALMVGHALAPATPAFEVLGLTLAGTMLALAIVEHAMLVLPVSTTALWRWAMGSGKAKRPPDGPASPGEPVRPDLTEQKKNALRAEAAPLPLDKHEQLLHAR